MENQAFNKWEASFVAARAEQGLIIKNAKWYYLSIFEMGRVDLT